MTCIMLLKVHLYQKYQIPEWAPCTVFEMVAARPGKIFNWTRC